VPDFNIILWHRSFYLAQVQYNLSYTATLNVETKWPYKTGGLSSQVQEKGTVSEVMKFMV